MKNYEDAVKIMSERFGKDSLIAVATSDGGKVYNRLVDAYYENGSFYLTTNLNTSKVKHIQVNSEVAIAAVEWFTGHGICKNLGWVLDPKNAEIRLKLREAFCAWYDYAIDEQNKNSCILEIKLTEGLLIKDHNEVRYKIDFINNVSKVSYNWGNWE